MKKIGVVGLGKVGLPLALVLREYGRHQVIGYDVNPRVHEALVQDPSRTPDVELQALLLNSPPLPIAPDLDTLVHHSDVIIVIVPTPHPEGFGGEVPQPPNPQPFDLRMVAGAVSAIRDLVREQGRRQVTILVTSTVHPGGFRECVPVDDELAQHGYMPVFISLGTVTHDLLTAPMILVGADHPNVYREVREIWTPVVNTIPIVRTTIATAEVIKLAINVARTTQITLANVLAQICEQAGADVDLVTKNMRWLPDVRAGMGEGGACRPRDLVALEWYCMQHRLPTEMFAGLVNEREAHTVWLAEMLASEQLPDPKWILGMAYKPGVPYWDGSPALLLRWLVDTQGGGVQLWDPIVDPTAPAPKQPGTFFIGTPHGEVIDFCRFDLPAGSVVIDPWGVVRDLAAGSTLIRPGRIS